MKSKIDSGSMKGKVFISALSAYTLALDNSERNAGTIASLLQDIIGKLQTLGMIAFHGHLVASSVVNKWLLLYFPEPWEPQWQMKLCLVCFPRTIV